MKNMSLGAVIGIASAVFAVAVGGGVLSGYLVKKHRLEVLSTPVVDMSGMKVLREKNRQDATYYAVEGITATTGTGDPVNLVIHGYGLSFSPDKNGRFISVPSNSDGIYFVSASNARTGVKAKDLEIRGFSREPWDPACVPSVDVSGARVLSVVGVSEYHYTLVGVRVNIKPGADVKVYIKNNDNGDVLQGNRNSADGTWTVTDVPATDSGAYVIYALNVSDETESEEVEINGFRVIRPVQTPSPAQLEHMYRTGDYDRYSGVFLPGYSFVFSGAPIIGLRPHTNQEVCTQLRIHAWDNIRVVRVETDCLGRISRVHIRVINS